MFVSKYSLKKIVACDLHDFVLNSLVLDVPVVHIRMKIAICSCLWESTVVTSKLPLHVSELVDHKSVLQRLPGRLGLVLTPLNIHPHMMHIHTHKHILYIYIIYIYNNLLYKFLIYYAYGVALCIPLFLCRLRSECIKR